MGTSRVESAWTPGEKRCGKPCAFQRMIEVETAFLTVPRHVFLPGVDLREAYSPKVVVTKRADNGTAISSASAPNLVAEMLEQLEVQPGHRLGGIGDIGIGQQEEIRRGRPGPPPMLTPAGT